ncbi:MAG: UV DNA damage repair endonuclease UvsE [Chloroflexi bacterium]|nr:MAG: UV DNA damage repair endonuclease UvsE [Chloroflexota bacterium]
MTIRLGYACINTQLPASNRTCRFSNATPDRLLELTRYNLNALSDIIDWNAAHDILLFRISSEVIPFGSHPVNNLPWTDIFSSELAGIGEKIRVHGMRVSMHPGQFTVLNSPREEVVKNSVAELEYHTRFLDSLGVDYSHKIVLHLGGSYGDKNTSMERFIQGFDKLSLSARNRIVVENDEKIYTLENASEVSQITGSPVVFDVFHHQWNPSRPEKSLHELIAYAGSTWKEGDGRQKIHYSDQQPGKPPGSHSISIDIGAFVYFYNEVKDLELDIMLEVKNKEQSVLEIRKVLENRTTSLT